MSRRRLALAAALGAAAVILPDRLRLDHRFPFVDAVAWRPHACVVALAGAAALAPARRTRPAATALAAVALAGLGAVVDRTRRVPRPGPGPGDLTVLTVNVLSGRADTGGLAALIAHERPDVVVLPEAGWDYRAKLMPLLDGLGYRSWVSTGPRVRDIHGVALLVAERAGEVTVRVGDRPLRHLAVTGGILGGRVLHAVHTFAPTYPGRAPAWRRDLAALRRWCRAPLAPIVAGDLNATLDHRLLRAALGRCRSAADGTGQGLVGTFPASLPRWAGIQIDHVLIPSEAVTTRFEVHDIAGSDHRGVLVSIALP